VLKINKRDRDERCGEEKQKSRVQVRAELNEKRGAQQPGDELHQRIPEGNRGMTLPAPAQKQDVADDRNVVVESDSGSAVRATRRGVDKRFFERNAVNANIEEAPQSQAEQESEQQSHSQPELLPNKRRA
jgi:hypothetical protein